MVKPLFDYKYKNNLYSKNTHKIKKLNKYLGG